MAQPTKITPPAAKSGEVMPPEKSKGAVALATSLDPLLALLAGETGRKIKVLSHVSVPVLPQRDNDPIWVKFTSIIRQAVNRENAEGKKSDKLAPKIATVVNLKTGEVNTLVCNAAMVSGLADSFPNDTYVDKCFAMVSMLKKGAGDRNVRQYRIIQTDDPTAAPSA